MVKIIGHTDKLASYLVSPCILLKYDEPVGYEVQGSGRFCIGTEEGESLQKNLLGNVQITTVFAEMPCYKIGKRTSFEENQMQSFKFCNEDRKKNTPQNRPNIKCTTTERFHDYLMMRFAFLTCLGTQSFGGSTSTKTPFFTDFSKRKISTLVSPVLDKEHGKLEKGFSNLQCKKCFQ